MGGLFSIVFFLLEGVVCKSSLSEKEKREEKRRRNGRTNRARDIISIQIKSKQKQTKRLSKKKIITSLKRTRQFKSQKMTPKLIQRIHKINL